MFQIIAFIPISILNKYHMEIQSSDAGYEL